MSNEDEYPPKQEIKKLEIGNKKYVIATYCEGEDFAQIWYEDYISHPIGMVFYEERCYGIRIKYLHIVGEYRLLEIGKLILNELKEKYGIGVIIAQKRQSKKMLNFYFKNGFIVQSFDICWSNRDDK